MVNRKGPTIPFTHPYWFHCPNNILEENNLHEGSVADLIDSNAKSWNHNMVKKLYQYPACKDILHLPIPKTNGNIDKILWNHSFSSDYHVKTTYSLIHKSHTTSQHLNHKTSIIPANTWYLIWKVKLPMKILTFT